ncbi:TPA: branched-chain alpha-keto acid dehydrogenase subunit E2 [Escherichia coli]|nr:branched-chain alpha-keto acid dehydrogenase subunit E2 [Escherichia coli]HCN7435096.1 branched-chain alpha-keto acid dehydrogenase subunit E2 [Escherichia coli]HCN7522279.1 branched-chain alpha-keto acid dehydrogenase subunit E2 [Escherichia coli]HCN7941266.1 branched-chain alpha-keto acid dehydrogenase subunit E2 [Escherichia coli]HCN8712471.1 branched-chain alpha-keto acid dehydrogenase subunit E2 [Escherichia coli]
MKYTKKLVALHKGLSLIESAMVLAMSATITSGILYYYNHAKENRELEESIKQIQTIAATINKLYSNTVTPPVDDNANDATIDAIASVSGLKTVKEGNQKVFVSATGKHTQLKWMTNSQKRRVALLSTHARSISSCMSYAILNLGTLMASKTRVTHNGQNIDKPGFDNSLEKPYYLTPSEASQQCEFAYDAMNGDGQSIIINYAIMY